MVVETASTVKEGGASRVERRIELREEGEQSVTRCIMMP